MTYLDSDHTLLDMLIKAAATVPLAAWIGMVAAGTLAHHHPATLGWLFSYSYWDWLLVLVVARVIQRNPISKWWVKEDKTNGQV